ncbi:MAG: hypothetical protein WAW86_05050 [Gammaproteobacteria bacterium]
MRRLLNQLMPFFILGVAVIVFLFGIMLLAYLFLFGALVGIIFYLFNKIRDYFYPRKNLTVPPTSHKSGRIIDSDDYKEL